MRPIDAINYGENLVWLIGHGEFSNPQDALRRALYDLAQTPTLTLDDLRPKGRWKPIHTEGCCNPYDDLLFEWECSVCGDRFADEEDYMPYKFCPSCGADMRGGAEDG